MQGFFIVVVLIYPHTFVPSVQFVQMSIPLRECNSACLKLR